MFVLHRWKILQKINSGKKKINPLVSNYNGHSCRTFLLFSLSNCIIQLICVAKGTGLGLAIKGGANRAEGPMVFIQEIIPGGDCQRVKHMPEILH